VSGRREVDLARTTGPALATLFDGWLEEAVPAVPLGADARLNNVDSLPLNQQRTCKVYGLDRAAKRAPASRFAAVIIRVGRYRFAVPLNMLDSVARAEGRVTPLAGKAGWHRGVVSHRGGPLALVDLAALLGLGDAPVAAQPDHLLVLPGARVAILCDGPPESLMLGGDDIRWCRPGSKRPWLAAMLPRQMCVLMDVEAVSRLIGHESCL
jgi:chemotaxis signal transduction protein